MGDGYSRAKVKERKEDAAFHIREASGKDFLSGTITSPTCSPYCE